ncbi:putative bifunctional diguanylate cyclase/phosphodiesterase [Actinoplanes sp. GCM10030250]|uniref:putative bifunctional diguanylate cyclase/phosphodiesterase n=1 Tax=Actinoplanes sp. GCM10030250 TaxID=3273376 RepID=UPI003671D6F4
MRTAAVAATVSMLAEVGLIALGTQVSLPKALVWIPAATGLIVAFFICRRTAATLDGPLRDFWRRFSWACSGMLAAAISQAVDVLTLPATGVPPVSARTMVIYIVASTVAATTLVRLPAGTRTWRQRATAVLDVAVVTLAVLMAGAEYLSWFGSALGDEPAAVRLNTAVMAITVAGIVIVLKAMMSRTNPMPWPALWFLSPIAVAAPMSVILMDVLRPWPYLNGSAAVLPAAGLMCSFAAQLTSLNPAPPVPRISSRRGTTVPLLASVLAGALVVTVYARNGQISGAMVAATAGMLVLVAARQAFALADNSILLNAVTHHAEHDELTGLFNRRHLAATITGSSGTRTVVLIDLIGFRSVNESLGTKAGDILLTAFAARITEVAGPGAMVARVGGDDFGLLLPGPAASAPIAELLTLGREPLHVDGQDVLIDVAAGVADGGDDEAADLYRRAGIALRAAMASVGPAVVRYDAALEQQVTRRNQMAADMQRGLADGEFHLLYQPIVTLPGGRINGVEALVRWRRRDGRVVSPGEFIPVAEDTGTITELGAWILDAACAQAALWQQRYGSAAPRVGINVSARQLLDPRLPSTVATTLAKHGLTPAGLTIEITETAVFGGGQALATVHALSAQGMTIALDDFGTGHSSLGLLRTCPVDAIKVDKSFVDGLGGTPQQEAIVTALAGIATTMGLHIVAEGVETEAQATRLVELGYHNAQGFHFAVPLPAAEVEEMLGVPALVR